MGFAGGEQIAKKVMGVWAWKLADYYRKLSKLVAIIQTREGAEGRLTPQHFQLYKFASRGLSWA